MVRWSGLRLRSLHKSRSHDSPIKPWHGRVVFLLLVASVAIAALVLATLSYVDITTREERIVQGVYNGVKAASTESIFGTSRLRGILNQEIPLIIDGVDIQDGDRFLLKNELNAQQNGIYFRESSTGEIFRAEDLDMLNQVVEGNTVLVEEGTLNRGQTFTLTTLKTGEPTNPVTGRGIEFRNTTNVLLGLIRDDIPDGFSLFSDASMVDGVIWKAGGGGGTGTVISIDTGTGLTGGPITTTGTISMADMEAFTIKANATATSAAPTDLTITRGGVLTQDATGLISLPVGPAGQILSSDGIDILWMAVGGTGTVTSVTQGTGITCTPNPIIAAGTVALATQPANTVMMNATAGALEPAGVAVARGDLITRAAGNIILLGPGAVDTALTSDGTDITYTKISNAMLATMPATTIKMNATAGVAVPTDVLLARGELITRDLATTILPPGVAGLVLTSGGAGVDLAWAAAGGTTVYTVYESLATTLPPAQTPVAGTYIRRNVNTTEGPLIPGNVTVAANAFTLAAGTWLMHATAPAYRSDNHKIKLIETAPVLGDRSFGTSCFAEDAAQGDQTRATLDFAFTIAVPTTYEIQHHVAIAGALLTLTFGLPTSDGSAERYTEIQLIKIA